MPISLSRAAGIAILLLWVISLVLPVFIPCGGKEVFPGWSLLIFGFLGIFVLQPAWFANILILIVGGMLIGERRVPVWLGAATALIASCAWYFDKMYGDNPAEAPICQYYAGYWLWLGVALIAFAAPVIVRLFTKPV